MITDTELPKEITSHNFASSMDRYSSTSDYGEVKLKPEDRLLRAGEKYKEKQKKMWEEEFQRRRHEEDKILEIQRCCHRQRAKQPVEQRLYNYLEKYRYRQQERYSKNEAEKLLSMKNPSIDPKSEQIVSKMNVSK